MGFLFLFFYTSFQRFSISYGGFDRLEDNILYNAIKMNIGESIYVNPEKAAVTSVIYPPAYIFLVSTLIPIFGVKIWLGRLISIISALFIGKRIFTIVKEETHDLKLAMISGLLFFAFYGITKQWYDHGRTDLFYALLIIESFYYAYHFKKSIINKYLIIILSVVIFFTRQTGLYVTFGCLIYFLMFDKKFAFIYLTSVIGIGMSLFGWIQFQNDGWFYYYNFEILKNAPLYIISGLSKLLRYFFYSSIIYSIIFIYIIYLYRIDKPRLLSFWPLMFILTFFSCLPALMKIGGDINSIIPVGMVGSVILGFAINELKNYNNWEISYDLKMTIVWGALIVQMIMFLYKPLVPNNYDIQNIDKLTTYVNSVKGDIYVDRNPSLAFLNNKKVYDDSAIIRDLDLTNNWNPERLINLFESQHFELVFSQLRYEPNILKDAILSNYGVIDEIDNNRANMSYPYKILAQRKEAIE